MTSAARGRDALTEADQLIDRHDPARRTLNPEASRARDLREVHARVLRAVGCEARGELSLALAEGLSALARAQLDNFPENLFWDFDFLAAAVLREAVAAAARDASAAALVRARFEQIVRLHEIYGRHTPIRFRYVHDFTYGYDWAKWVRRGEPARARVGPFEGPFLGHMERRGGELLELIAGDDQTYPTLTDSRPRNPFGFSREPGPEALLHGELARLGQLPIEAWRVDAQPDPRPDYTAIRADRALALGLAIT